MKKSFGMNARQWSALLWLYCDCRKYAFKETFYLSDKNDPFGYEHLKKFKNGEFIKYEKQMPGHIFKCSITLKGVWALAIHYGSERVDREYHYWRLSKTDFV